MRRLLPLTSIWFLLLAFATAMNSNMANSQSIPTSSGNVKERIVRGCLSSVNGIYTLTDPSGRVWQLEGNTGQLTGEVGHTVAITGRGSNAAVMTETVGNMLTSI
jgi:hypothetical protein